MGYGKKILFRVVLTVALLTGISFLSDGHAKAQGADFQNIPAPDEKGAYNVGFTEFCATMTGGRVSRFVVWYPTLDSTMDPSDCSPKYPVYPTSGAAIPNINSCFPTASYHVSSPLCAVKEATLAPGPFPLVAYSHGGMAGPDRARFDQIPVHETLASHGFIVVVALHIGTPTTPLAPTHDIKRVIDIMLNPNNNGTPHTPNAILDAIPSKIDSERIGLSGHSTGGQAALRLAGGCSTVSGCAVPIPDPRVKTMVLYEPGPNSPIDSGKITVPYLVMGGTQFLSGLAIPALFDTTVLATPRIYVRNPQAVHMSYTTGLCSIVDDAREAALEAADPNVPPAEPLAFPCSLPGTPQGDACSYWNFGEIANRVGFGCGRNFCNRVGTSEDSNLSLDTDDDGFTDSPPFVETDLFTLEPAISGEIMEHMVKLYTVAFFKKFLEGDGRYMRYLTPGYADSQNFEETAVVEIRE